MRLVIFTSYFHPHKGGVESYVRDLFSGIDAEKIIVTANTENAPSYEKWGEFKIYRLECWHMLGKTYPVIKPSEFSIVDSLMKTRPDFVITNTRFFHTSLLGAKFASKYSVPLIHIEHGTQHSPIKNPIFRLGGIIYDHMFGRYVIKKAYKVVGISKASEKFIKHLHHRDTTLVYNSIDSKKFACKRQFIVKYSTENPKNYTRKKTIIYVGRLIYAKGVQDLLEATKDMDVEVTIVGDGDYKDKLININPKAKFLGQKTSKEISALLSQADIFVNPSYAEGLPTSILEAGASGLPIIATDVGGTREIIDDGVNGFLIRPKDRKMLHEKISILINNPRLCSKFSKNIMPRIVKEFDWKNTRKKFKVLLRS